MAGIVLRHRGPVMIRRASASFLPLLCNLRWLAVVGQATAVAVEVGPMQVPLEAAPLLEGIATLALFNLYANWRAHRTEDVRDREVFAHMLVDIAVLGWLIYWSGGME